MFLKNKWLNCFFYSLKKTGLIGALVLSNFVFLNATSYAGEAKTGQGIILASAQDSYLFSNRFSYLVDDSNQLSFSQVRDKNITENFTLIQRDNLMLGYVKSTVWVTFTIKNLRDENVKWLLNLDYPLLDQIDIYSAFSNLADDPSAWQYQSLGDNQVFSARPINHRTFTTALAIEYLQEKTFYIRIQTTSSMQIRPSVSSSQYFFSDELGKEMFYGIIYGIMLLMAVYNVFLYLAVRDISYLVYVFSVLSGCIFIMALNGHAYQYLWPNTPMLANKAIPLFTSLWMTGTALFTQMFLETKQFAPRLYRAINILLAFAVFSVFFSLFGEYQAAIKIATVLALFNGALILIASIVCWRSGNQFARFFVAAWVVYAMGTAMLVLSRFGLFADNFVTHNSASLGLLVEIIMLSLALSDKYRVLTQKLAQHATELEHKVALRTQELEQSNIQLEQSNIQLEQLSRIDSLTGLPNRRHFDSQLNQEWERLLREKKCLSILICDIDEFKSINDHFGHQYGDKCLKAVARVLEEALHRPADMAARFGGDEFVIILPDTCKLGAELLGIKICQMMEDLKMNQAPEASYDYVTLSLGCATLTPDNSNNIKKLFSLADENLFIAKDKGRNCVVS